MLFTIISFISNNKNGVLVHPVPRSSVSTLRCHFVEMSLCRNSGSVGLATPFQVPHQQVNLVPIQSQGASDGTLGSAEGQGKLDFGQKFRILQKIQGGLIVTGATV
jgi:hypothetical protein